jgi:hypothetical protein
MTPAETKEMSDLANAMHNSRAFCTTITTNELGSLNAIVSYRLGQLQAIPATAAENFPGLLEKWEAYKAEQNKPVTCPNCGWAVGHEPTCRRVTATVVSSPFTKQVPQVGWADLDVFEVNYPDKTQVLLDRTEAGEIDVRVWRIGDPDPLYRRTVYLPEKTDCKRCHDRVGEDSLNVNGLCRECAPSPEDLTFLEQLTKCLELDYSENRSPYIYEGYSSVTPEDATFIVAGQWTIAKMDNGKLKRGEYFHYILQAPAGDGDSCEVARFTNVWALAQRILEEDAKERIANRIEHVQTSEPVF